MDEETVVGCFMVLLVGGLIAVCSGVLGSIITYFLMR